MAAPHSVIQDATLWLDSRLIESENEELDPATTLTEFLSRWRLIDVIDSFAHDPKLLCTLSKRAYRHSNGFDRLQLLPPRHADYGLRLHIWWGDEGVSKERVHGHPWNFASRVLVGSLNFEQFIESHSGEVVEVSEYARPDGRLAYELTHVGTTKLRPILRGAMPAGTSYSADHELLHRVWVNPGQPAATLMLHGKGIAYPSRVFFPQGSKNEIEKSHSREQLDVESLRLTLSRARSLLAGTPF